MIRSFKVLIAGVVILGFGIAILCANSPERVNAIADELVEATSVLPENEGKLVMVTGTPQLMNGGVVVDDETGLRVENALSYSRIPYQKVYAEKKEKVIVSEGKDKFSTDDDVTETRYYVAEEWINADHDRDEVVRGNGTSYENPPALRLSAYFAGGDLRLEDFSISYADVLDYLDYENGSFTQQELADACGSYIKRSELNLRAVENEYGHGMLSSGDEVGDVHVMFSYTALKGAEPVTVIGRQRGDRLVLEEDDIVTESEQVQAGGVTKEAFIDSLAAEDKVSRRFGIVGVVLGVILLLVSFEWDWLPFGR